MVVITRSVQAPSPAIEAMIRRHTQCPIFYATTQLESVLRVPQLDGGAAAPGLAARAIHGLLRNRKSAAFFEDLRKWGFQVVG